MKKRFLAALLGAALGLGQSAGAQLSMPGPAGAAGQGNSSATNPTLPLGNPANTPPVNPLNRNPALRNVVPELAPALPDVRDSTSRPVNPPPDFGRDSTSRPSLLEPDSGLGSLSSQPGSTRPLQATTTVPALGRP